MEDTTKVDATTSLMKLVESSEYARSALAEAALFVQSGLFSDIKSLSQGAVKILAGREQGLGPFQSIQNVYIIEAKGGTKLAYHYSVLLGRVEKSGRYRFRIREWDETLCRIEWFEGDESLGFSEWTMADAQRAGTSNMHRFPKAMHLSKAAAQGVRAYCPSVMGGAPAFVPEDFMDAEPDTPPEPGAFESHRPRRKSEVLPAPAPNNPVHPDEDEAAESKYEVSWADGTLVPPDEEPEPLPAAKKATRKKAKPKAEPEPLPAAKVNLDMDLGKPELWEVRDRMLIGAGKWRIVLRQPGGEDVNFFTTDKAIDNKAYACKQSGELVIVTASEVGEITELEVA